MAKPGTAYSPKSAVAAGALAFYDRGVKRRGHGDTEGARADLKRAAALATATGMRTLASAARILLAELE